MQLSTLRYFIYILKNNWKLQLFNNVNVWYQ